MKDSYEVYIKYQYKYFPFKNFAWMKLSDFNFNLPEHLIAKHPTKIRSASRLLHLNGKTGAVEHKQFVNAIDLLEQGDLLVFNNTKVIPARMLGKKQTGGQVECWWSGSLEVIRAWRMWASKSPKPGTHCCWKILQR